MKQAAFSQSSIGRQAQARPRVLLAAVNSQYIHTNPALFALVRGAEEAGCASILSTLDLSTNLPPDQVEAELCQAAPDVLALSVNIWNIAFLTPILADLRQLLPNTLILLGGPEASQRAGDYLRRLPIDGVAVGEGEESFPALLTWVQQRPLPWRKPEPQELPSIPGWLWPGREEEFRPAPRPDLASLPFLYNEEDLAWLSAKGKVVYYESSRGCPFACSFCASAGEPLRQRPLSLVREELPRLAAVAGQIKFVDRTFNADPQRAAALTRQMLDLYRPGLSWHCEISPFCLTEELIRLWLSAPKDYLKLEMGVQTLSPKALSQVGRQGQWRKVEPQVRSLIAAGNTQLHLDLIAGLPGDTPAQFAAAFHQLHQLNAHYLQLGFLKVLPGSLLAARAREFGLVYSASPPYGVLATPSMSAEYLFGLRAAERAFNALYNRGEFRETLLAKAEAEPGGALDLYYRAAQLLRPDGTKKNKSDVVAAL